MAFADVALQTGANCNSNWTMDTARATWLSSAALTCSLHGRTLFAAMASRYFDTGYWVNLMSVWSSEFVCGTLSTHLSSPQGGSAPFPMLAKPKQHKSSCDNPTSLPMDAGVMIGRRLYVSYISHCFARTRGRRAFEMVRCSSGDFFAHILKSLSL